MHTSFLRLDLAYREGIPLRYSSAMASNRPGTSALIIRRLLLGLCIVVLSALIGHSIAGVSGGIQGGVLGVILSLGAYATISWMRSSTNTRLLGTRRRPDRDWSCLLEHEKCYYARQLERDGHVVEARTIYAHLVNRAYPHPLPFERLANLYRRERQPRKELRVLRQALETLPNDGGRTWHTHRRDALADRLDALHADAN